MDHFVSLENTTLSAGLGQSRQPLQLGMERFERPDVVRFRWPDIVWQAELNLLPGNVNVVHETNLKSTSCPVVFGWNGSRFGFVTDFLGAGSMGELAADGELPAAAPRSRYTWKPINSRL